MRDGYEVIVIGGGHAGTEAAWAAASVFEQAGGGRVALVTMDPRRIGQMSCNPAIGGLAKGQMVREVDALGGLMGRAIDATGIMFKMLNTSKGAAVRGPRAQADKYAYAAEVRRLIASRPGIEVIAGTVDDVVVENDRITGVVIESRVVATRAVVLTTGTFMHGLMHTGEKQTAGGRVDEGSAVGISATLQRLGFELGRLKTGTPPRLARESLDWDALPPQVADDVPVPFSDMSPDILPGEKFPRLPQVECRVTSTTAEAHDLIRANLHNAPMFSGQIEAVTGPRYCPSIEDKVVRFADRSEHHVFLEPESLETNEIYCNGISTSLPVEVQERLVRLMPGCERAEILRWGYAVEYDMVWPHQIDATCEAKHVGGLFLAGQINCTTGYEEAAGQGVVAGLNAARRAVGEETVRLQRDEAYIGVMLDDLVTKTPREPYRMFTSRAEHRLRLRADNADERLTPLGRRLGLVDDRRWQSFERRRVELERLRSQLDRPVGGGRRVRDLARRQETTVETITPHLDGGFDTLMVQRVLTDAKYEGYVARQQSEIKRQHKAESTRLPAWLDYQEVPGLRSEAAETLARFRPATLGQAGRLSGVNPADLTLVAVAIRRGASTGTDPSSARPA
jgi:tRNA uridine 5-carboxymethylaminomethyl modification enzyme